MVFITLLNTLEGFFSTTLCDFCDSVIVCIFAAVNDDATINYLV